MMKRYILAILACCLLGLTACYEDNSTLPTDESTLNKIQIGELRDTSVIAYSSVLKITPEVSGYADSELSYAWYIYGGQFSEQIQNGFRTVKISDQKTLSYEITLKQGKYTLVFEATSKMYGYSVTQEMGMQVLTPFAQGFYILKETADGNTELDIYNLTAKTLGTDVLTLTQGAPLSGAPRTLNTVYSKAYVDPETANPGDMITAFVAYGQNEFACFRTEDLLKVFDRSSLLFTEMEEDEIPYGMATAAMANFYFSSKGVRTDGYGGNEYGTGKLGYPAGNGGSGLIQACDGRGLLYWDIQNRRLMYASDGGTVNEVRYTGNDIVRENTEAIATGWNYLAGTNTVWYLLEDQTGQRYLAFVDKGYNITKVQRLELTSHLNRGQVVAGNGKTSLSIYVVDDNIIYRYNIEDGSESQVKPEGLSVDGSITFLSNIFYGSSTFDYIVIGVQNDNDYTLYAYNMIGGLPYGTPVHKTSGKGILKEVRYVSGIASTFAPNLYPFYGMMGPDFPY